MPRVFVAGLFHETHTFLEAVTRWQDFSVLRGSELFGVQGDSSPLGGALEAAQACGWEIVPGLMASAVPSAIVEDEVLERYWQEFSTRLKEAEENQPLDAIYLVLHGAMTCQSVPDVEGELLERLSTLLLPRRLPTFGVYDLHANFSERMADYANGLVAYRLNPHTDGRESGVRAVHLLDRCLREGIKPETYLAQPGIVWPPTGTGTHADPMQSLEQKARSLQQEHPTFWEVNVNAGFSFADTPDTGVSFTIVTSGPAEEAEAALQELSQLAWKMVDIGNVVDPPANELLAQLAAEPPSGLTVIAEPSDNIGGGAPGDGTGLLRAFLAHQLTNAAICLNDPAAVALLQQHQPGETITVSLGGKGSQLDPGPLTLDVELVSLSDGYFTLCDPHSHLASMVGDRFDMGDCVIVRHAGVTILLTSFKTPPMDLGQWKHVGIDPAQFSFVGVKAAVSHRRAWDPIAQRNFTVSTPGPCSSELTSFPFEKLRRPCYPWESQPPVSLWGGLSAENSPNSTASTQT